MEGRRRGRLGMRRRYPTVGVGWVGWAPLWGGVEVWGVE